MRGVRMMVLMEEGKERYDYTKRGGQRTREGTMDMSFIQRTRETDKRFHICRSTVYMRSSSMPPSKTQRN